MIIEFEGSQYTITLDNGYYNHDQLTIALKKLIKRETGDNDFIITYNVVNRKFYFGHSSKEFKFLFDVNIDYDILKLFTSKFYILFLSKIRIFGRFF